MASIIEFELPTEEFALEGTLTTVPEARIEIERVVADDPEQITPYVWVRTDDFDAFEAALEDDPTVESVTMLSEMSAPRSYQMTWTGSIDFVVQILTAHQGTITHADGANDGWNLRVVFPDRESLSRAHDAAREAGFGFDVRNDLRDGGSQTRSTRAHRSPTRHPGSRLRGGLFHRPARDDAGGTRRPTGYVTSGALGAAQTSDGPARRVDARHSRR